MINGTKNCFDLSASGNTMKTADFSVQSFSVSRPLSKHINCSISESMKDNNRLIAVDITEAMLSSGAAKACLLYTSFTNALTKKS